MTLIESLESRRLYSFGAADAGFGVKGHVTAPTIGNSNSGFVEALTQSDGKIVAGVGGGLTRFTAEGVVDTTFGTGGIVGFKGYSFRDAALDGSGRIYVLAVGTSGTLVRRYTAGGQLDTAFATSGTALVESSNAFRARALAVGADGKIVVAGVRIDPDTSATVGRVYRLNANGTKDTTFGSSGIAVAQLGTTDLVTPVLGDSVADVRVMAGGKIELLGSSYNYAPSSTSNEFGDYIPPVPGNSVVALARLTAAGQLDSSFGSSGVARRAVFDGELLASNGGVIRADGSAVISINDDQQTASVGFGASGSVAFRTYVPHFYNAFDATDAAALPDGRVAFAGYNGAVWTVDTAGAISNVVTPGVTNTQQAITATADDDLVTVGINDGSLLATGIDAGTAADARPDDLPAGLAIDSVKDQYGTLHVAYFDSASKTLKYTYRNSAGLWGRTTIVDATRGAGANLSIAVTHVSGRSDIAIGYYAAGTADLKVAGSANGRKFTIQTVSSKGAVGLSPSLLFTDTGGYAVSYYSKTTASLYYSVYNGKAWSYEVVDTGGAGAWNELQFDGITRRPAIAYSGPKDTVKYALKSKAGWGSTVAATTAAGAGFVNLALPYDVTYYGPLISYYDLNTADLVLLRYDRNAAAGKRWTPTTVASRGIVGSYSDLFTDNSGNATLYAWNRSSDAVLKIDINRYDSSPTTTVVATGGGRYLTAAGAYSDSSPGDATDLAYLDTGSGTLFVR